MKSNGKVAAHSYNVMVDEACANIDYKYGPYSSVQEAFNELYEMEVLAVGLTVGVLVDGKITEYWFESSCEHAADLVPKINGGGGSAYTVSVFTTSGNIQLSGGQPIVAYAVVYHGDEDITDTILPSKFDWQRKSVDTVGDALWNSTHKGVGSSITISDSDVVRQAMFECVVNL